MNLPADYQRVLPVLLVSVLALGAAVLVVRGLGGADDTTSAQQILDRAAKKEPKSGHLNARFTFSISSPAQRGRTWKMDSRVSGRGTDVPGGKTAQILHFTERTTGKGPVSVDELSTGQQGFVRVGATWYRLTRTQSKRVFESNSIQSPNVDPLQWAINPKLAGTRHVDGVQANHLIAEANINAMFADLELFKGEAGDTSAVRALNKAVNATAKRGTMVVDVGEDGVLRRLAVSGQLDTLTTVPLHMATTFSFAFSRVNEPVSVRAPGRALSSSRIRRLARARFGGQADDILGPQKRRPGRASYVTCVGDAQNLAALARCQKLLP